MSVPSWVQDSIFYQIFPDRFFDGDFSNNPPNLIAWGSAPTIYGFQGGDLRGIINRMYYLVDLGINAIYLNPIFLSTSNHRYNTTDYYQIDPKLGTMKDFKALLDIAHRNQVKIIIDGVFNHCGRGFFAFNDVLENQTASPYTSWYHIKKYPVDAYSPGDAVDYAAWWKFKSLPKFNTGNPLVRKYIFDVARYWVEQGIDGWRLDVPNEIDDDSFWLQFRQEVKKANSDAYLVGEIWDGNPRWVGDSHFDGLMHYPVRDLILDLLREKVKASKFVNGLQEWYYKYPHENSAAMYVLLGSHDTERYLTLLGKNIEKAKLGYLIQFTYPGAPAIYYGDEIGLEGGKDPDCRRAFIWDESQWNIELRGWIKSLIAMRKQNSALRSGTFSVVMSDDNNGLFAFSRHAEDQVLLVLINASASIHDLELDMGSIGLESAKAFKNLLGSEIFTASEGKVSIQIPAWKGVVLSKAG